MRDDEIQRHYEVAEKLLAEQNFVAAAIAGGMATLLSAIAYGIVVEKWPVVYGFAAVGLGTVVGFFIGFVGRGVTPKFSVLAAVYTIVGCILGNLLARIWNQAKAPASSLADVIRDNSMSDLARWSLAGLSPMDLLFWFVAVVAAVFLAKRPLSRADRLALGLYKLDAEK